MRRRTSPHAETVRLVRERDDWRCVRCASGWSLTTQHRVARGMGGTRAAWINLPANLITLCGSGTTGCHGWVEHHPESARALGLAVPRSTPPLEVPVWTWRGWMVLDDEGRQTPMETETRSETWA